MCLWFALPLNLLEVMSLRAGVHLVYELQSTLESTIFEGFIIYLLVLHKKMFHMTMAVYVCVCVYVYINIYKK